MQGMVLSQSSFLLGGGLGSGTEAPLASDDFDQARTISETWALPLTQCNVTCRLPVGWDHSPSLALLPGPYCAHKRTSQAQVHWANIYLPDVGQHSHEATARCYLTLCRRKLGSQSILESSQEWG